MEYLRIMDRIKKIFKGIYGVGWIFIFLFFNWVVYGENVPNPFFTAGVLTLVCLPVFWSHYFLYSRCFNRNKFGLYVTGVLALLLLSPLLFLLCLGVEVGPWHLPMEYFPFLILTFLMVIISGIAKGTENWLINTFQRQELEKQSMRSELAYLKAQINPHFLFNTLNNIHTLAYKQSPATPEAIMRLSSQMRYMIYESNASTVALSREIEYLEDFISLQQLRYKESPIVDFEISGDTETCYVAPLLFIHLMENAYKHSPAQLQAGAIRLRLEVSRNSLTFSVSNPAGKPPGKKQQNVMDEPGGFGLANMQKRLELLYPNQHSFEISSSESLFQVVLKIHHQHLQDHERKADVLHRG
jgi:sensor histidine kinase YesM